MTGILVVNKPMDYTSFDCVALLKGICHEKKIGHTGTLDPNATGVLPICFGKATRLIEYMEAASKTYVCRARFGYSSDTDDIWGELTQYDDFVFPAQDAIEKGLKTFLGEIEQYPPMYSAVRVNGRRLYSYARSGESVDIKPRTVTIHNIELTGYYPCQNEIVFSVTCSRGTYIRTICKDLGNLLGVPCIMSALVRNATSGFTLSESYDFEELRKMSAEEVEKLLLPIDRAITGMPRIELFGKDGTMFQNGMTVINNGPDTDSIAVFKEENLVGIARREKNKLKPIKVFN